MTETVQTYLEYHAFEGGILTPEYARELLSDAIDCGLLSDAQRLDQIDIQRECDAANMRAKAMAKREGVTL